MRIRVLCLLLMLFAPLTRATTVIPPTFAELVGEAEAIYRGRVTAVESRHVVRPDGSKMIKTFVRLGIERALKGPDQAEITLEFLGGTVGDETVTVSGMPTFKPGDREFVFVRRNGLQFCPLVAVMHGRYRILHDEGSSNDYVARDNRAPLTDVSEVGLPMRQLPEPVRAASLTHGLSPSAFEASIVSEIQRPTPRARLH